MAGGRPRKSEAQVESLKLQGGQWEPPLVALGRRAAHSCVSLGACLIEKRADRKEKRLSSSVLLYGWKGGGLRSWAVNWYFQCRSDRVGEGP